MPFDPVIEDLKRRVSIIDAIEATRDPVTGGALHIERKPYAKTVRCQEHDSLKVWPHTNTWYWWSQSRGGDIFDWIMWTTGCDFSEAKERAERGDYGSRVLPVVSPAVPKPVIELPVDLHLRYHRALDAKAREWWHEQGANDELISRFWLGVCIYHPIWQQPTYSIPVIVGGKLVNVRHRLAHPAKTGDKYRPERAGLPTELFNSDILTPIQPGVIVVAGEKKVIVMAGFGLPAVSSTAGCGHWDDAWTTRFTHCRKVYVAFDPGEGVAAEDVACRIGERAFLVDLPEKPDDYLLRLAREQGHDEAVKAFREHLKQARPHVNADVWAKRNGGSQWGRMRQLPK